MSCLEIGEVKITHPKSIDKDIQFMLQPLNIIQTMCLYPKYRIKNNIIYPNSRLSNIISISGTILFISLFLFRLLSVYFNYALRKNFHFIYIVSYYDFFFNAMGCILNCFLTIVQVNKNIEFVLTIQRIHIFLNNKKYPKFFTLVTWLFILHLFIYYILILRYFYWSSSALINLILICFDVNMIYAIRCITLLKDMLNLWNEEVLRPQLMRDMDMKDYSKAMFQTYTDILSAYDTLKLTFKHFILFYVLELFSQALVNVRTGIEAFKWTRILDHNIFPKAVFGMTTWLIKTFSTVTILCLYCEKFYIGLENSEDLCALITKARSSDSQLKLSKNIRRLYQSSFKRISASGLFYIDAALPLSLVGLITGYTVVLIQFALSKQQN